MARAFSSTAHKLANASAAAVTTAGTIALWIKPTFAGNDSVTHVFFNYGDASPQLPAFYKQADNYSRAVFHISAFPGTQRAGVDCFTSGVWAHHLITWDTAVGITYYVDGVSMATYGTFSFSPGTGLHIGNYTDSTTFDAACTLMEYGRWTRVLTSPEIADLAAKKSAAFIPTGLVHHYKLKADPGGGNPEPDEIGTEHLTVTGAAYDSADPGILYPGTALAASLTLTLTVAGTLTPGAPAPLPPLPAYALACVVTPFCPEDEEA